MMNENSEILAELRRMTKLLALIATESRSQSEKVQMLNQFGFSAPEIGDLLGITANAVRLVVHKAKKKEKGEKKIKGEI